MLTLQDVRSALRSQLLSERPGRFHEFAGVTNDSRVAKPGEIFVALRSDARDGHDFVADAVRAGVAAVVAHRDVSVPEGVALFRVRNTTTALGELASHWRDRFRVKAVVITGSVGKTTTKELVAAVLGTRYQVLKSPANFNDEAGVSMTLFGLSPTHERAVLEVAMYEEGEIRRLCAIAKPEVAVVTNVGPSHMERLGSIEAIARAKTEAVEALPDHGLAVLNADDPRVAAMGAATGARVLTFGESEDANVRATDVRPLGLAGCDFDVTMAGRKVHAHSPLPGSDLVHDALAALAVAVADGMSLEEAAGALASASVPARLQVKKTTSGAMILDDSYNASPASMLAALSVLAGLSGRRLALLGDMLELGPAEVQGHEEVGRRAAEAADVLFTVGPRAQAIARAATIAGASCSRHFETKEEALAALRTELTEGDVLLVKASHGMALDSVVTALAS